MDGKTSSLHGTSPLRQAARVRGLLGSHPQDPRTVDRAGAPKQDGRTRRLPLHHHTGRRCSTHEAAKSLASRPTRPHRLGPHCTRLPRGHRRDDLEGAGPVPDDTRAPRGDIGRPCPVRDQFAYGATWTGESATDFELRRSHCEYTEDAATCPKDGRVRELMHELREEHPEPKVEWWKNRRSILELDVNVRTIDRYITDGLRTLTHAGTAYVHTDELPALGGRNGYAFRASNTPQSPSRRHVRTGGVLALSNRSARRQKPRADRRISPTRCGSADKEAVSQSAGQWFESIHRDETRHSDVGGAPGPARNR